MFPEFEFEALTAPVASFYAALALGVLFGLLAEQTKFCLRRSVVGPDRRKAGGVWAMALAVAVLGTQAAIWFGLIDFSRHRFFNTDMPVVAIVLGGLMFGAGMILTRGCASRLTVLSGTGNIRALATLVMFAIVANATLKGPLAQTRLDLGAVKVNIASAQETAIAYGAWIGVVLALGLIIFALRSGNSGGLLIRAAGIGAIVAASWAITGYVLYDDFDVIPLESVAFTLTAADTLFWITASSVVDTKFTLGLIAGVVAGAGISAIIGGRFIWVGFDGPRQMGRYALGAAMMGFGGVTAGGCTVGAGLAGIPTLSIAAVLALIAIIAGAKGMDYTLNAIPSFRGYGGLNTTLPQQPAE